MITRTELQAKTSAILTPIPPTRGLELMNNRGFLFLDDSELRWNNFMEWVDRYFYGHSMDVVWVDTYEKCIACLKEAQWDTVCLDHDLGTKKTGYDVAKWMEEQVFTKDWTPPPKVIVHTANSVGRKSIIDALLKINQKHEVEIDVRSFDGRV